MKALIFSAILLAAGAVSAQDATLVQPDLFCKIDQFSPAKGKAPTAAYKKCDKLLDKDDAKINSMEGCKQRGLEKAGECLRLLKADKVAVRGKFREQFKITSNTTTFICELDKSGDSACP